MDDGSGSNDHDGVAAGLSDKQVKEIVDRLSNRLGIERIVVDQTVSECLTQISGASVGALPELVERLAAQRLPFVETAPRPRKRQAGGHV